MPSKLTEGGSISNADASKTGAGLSRGPNLRRKLVGSAVSSTWPAPGATLDLDFANNRGFIFGQGQGGVMDAITFTRASNGTYVGPDGSLKGSRGLGKNLLNFPQDFDNAIWIKSNSTVLANAGIAPDSTSTADMITMTTTAGVLYQAPVQLAQVYTASVYFKQSTDTAFEFAFGTASLALGVRLRYNFTTGVSTVTLGGSPSNVTTNVISAGDGWFRAIITVLCTATNWYFDPHGTTAGGTTLIWGAQLELGSTATEYFPTNINTPRFDWASTTRLIQNLLTYTSPANVTVWTAAASDYPASTNIAFKQLNSFTGLNTAASFTNASSSRLTRTLGGISGNNTLSFYVSNVTSTLTLNFRNPSQGNGSLTINSSYEVAASAILSNPTITPVGSGWYRVTVYILAVGANTQISFTGGNVGTLLDMFQFEVGASATMFKAQVVNIASNTPLVASPTTNGILIEEPRTNLLLWSRDATQTPSNNLLRYSQTFTNAAWTGATGLTGSQQIAAGTTPYIVCTSSDGTSVYVGNTGSISIYTRDASTGALTANGSVTVNNFGLCISADGTSVYATSSGNTIAIYTRNTSTGALTANGTIATGTNPVGICISADGTSVYAANSGTNTISIYTRNTSTGALTANGTIASGTNLRTVIISPDGTSVYTNNGSIYTRNTSTGALTANGTITTSSSGICISPDGTSVYTTSYAGSGAIILYTRNTTTGALTAGTSVGGILAANMIVSLDGSLLYAVDAYYSIIFICTRNTSTGALTTKSTITPGAGATNIDISPDNLNAYVTNSTGTVSIYNAALGIATVTDNTFTAPDSTTTAATVTATSAGAVLRQTTPTISTRQYTFSVYLYRKTGTGNVDISFDGNTFTTQPVTDEWTRYSISGSNVVSPTFGIRLATAGDEVYVWGAQLEYGSTPSTYEVTTVSPAIWTKQNITAALDQTGIDGVANSATSLTATAAYASCIQIAAAASIIKTASVYLKAITVTGNIQVSIDGSTWSTVDLSNGLWNRIVLTATLANPVIGILIQNSGDSVAMDYGQIENSSFPTTPIFTGSATATRAIDSAFIPNNITKNFVNWNSGTISAKGAAVPVNTSGAIVNIGDGTYYRHVALRFSGSNVVGLWRNSDYFVFPNAIASIAYPVTLNTWNNFSLAGAWSMSRVSASIFGGTTVSTNAFGAGPTNYGIYTFDITAGAGEGGTNVKTFTRITIWPKAVSDPAVQLISGQAT